MIISLNKNWLNRIKVQIGYHIHIKIDNKPLCIYWDERYMAKKTEFYLMHISPTFFCKKCLKKLKPYGGFEKIKREVAAKKT